MLYFCKGVKLLKLKSLLREKAFCDPVGTRTQDPIIKSDVLYQLSYEIIPLFKTERGAKIIIIIF